MGETESELKDDRDLLTINSFSAKAEEKVGAWLDIREKYATDCFF